MRIVLTSNFSPWSSYSGGGQRSTHQLASALVELGHDVTVIYTAVFGRKPTPTEPTPYRIKWALFFGLRGRRSSPEAPECSLCSSGCPGTPRREPCGCSQPRRGRSAHRTVGDCPSCRVCDDAQVQLSPELNPE